TPETGPVTRRIIMFWRNDRPTVLRRTVLSLDRLEDRTLLSFGAFTSYTVGKRPEAVVVGDFIGNGILDLATPNSLTNNVSLLLGQGDGTFQDPINSSVNGAPG